MMMSHRQPRRRRRLRALRLLFAAASLVLLLGVLASSGLLVAATAGSRFEGVDRLDLASATVQALGDMAGEDPRFDANPPTGAVPICPGAPESAIKPMRLAFGLMRGTTEGARLFDQLVERNVCISVDDLDYAMAYAQSRWSSVTGWTESGIVVDRALIRSGQAAELAAVLVHEATHVDRVIAGSACHLSDDCRLLPNGVAIDEELAAHAAESEWWIEAFGRDGKRFAFGRQAAGENRVAKAYLDGEAAFDAYITRLRSDPRERQDF